MVGSTVSAFIKNKFIRYGYKYVLIHRSISKLRYLQPVNFFSKLADKFHIGILIDGGRVDDVLGPVGVAEGGEGLAVVDLGRGDGGDHDRLGVAAQAVLQQPRQHRVSAK